MKIRIIKVEAAGEAFSSLLPGTEHETVSAPPETTGITAAGDVWVQGAGRPVKLYAGEYEVVAEEWYYIQHIREFHGNAVVWWGRDSRGYTSDIRAAGKYARQEAERICLLRGQERAYPCSYIDGNEKALKTIVDMQYIDQGQAVVFKKDKKGSV